VQQTTHVMGTPSYMSPEQVKGRPVDGRTDIFSLGVVMYEMLTGEKPFPGQSITTVIYKIVNEQPVPPRQLNPSLHPGLNEIVMRALAKEPEQRYQSCRELLEDLRNYRALGADDRSNPDATLISSRNVPGQPFSTPTTNLRPHFEESAVAANAHSLQNRAAHPSQTPAIRRTGALHPIVEEPPKKTSTLATILAAIFLLCVIVWGGMRLRPELEAARDLNKTARAETAKPPATTENVPAPAASAAENATPAPEDSPAATPAATTPASDVSKTPVSATSTSPSPTPAVAKTIEGANNSPVMSYKREIEKEISQKGLTGHVKVSAVSNTLTLSGKLRPADHAGLLKFMRNAPPNVRVVDDIQYDDSPVADSDHADNGSHPVPSPGNGAIHVITDIVGATATLYGPAGRWVSACQTPCSFNDLAPERYSLQVQKQGYLTLQTALETRAGQTLDQKLHLEALAAGLYVSSRPPGADIFINGAKQSGQTPTTLPLAPGQYDLVLRIPGYEAFVEHIQIKDNIQTTLDAEMKPKSQQSHVAWAQVNSTPQGAEIFIDGNDSGQATPARVQVPTGVHIIGLHLNGYQVAKHAIESSEGGTVSVTETLRPR